MRSCEGCGLDLNGAGPGVRFHGSACRARAAHHRQPTRARTVLAYIAALEAQHDRAPCAYCHGPIPSTRRSDARYCSDEHRRAAARDREDAAETATAEEIDALAERVAERLYTALRDAVRDELRALAGLTEPTR